MINFKNHIFKQKKVKPTYLSPFLFSCFIGLPTLSHALPNECSNLTAPVTFVESTGVICLRNIQVNDNAGAQYYQAALQWVEGNSSNRFDLLGVEIDTASDQNNPLFSADSGTLTMPTVDIPKLNGTERYSASMELKSENGRDFFELLTVDQYIHPDYIPNQRWKPYGLLDTDERQSVDLLARSLPYAKLANAVYNFGIPEVDGWKLVEQVSKDSGMQAGGYFNESTGEIIVAFRGTEFCINPISCSFDELKESLRDVGADSALTVGESPEQFQDAVEYIVDLTERFPNIPITLTGHSLGGSLAQGMGYTFGLETFAFNSAPVPEDFTNAFIPPLSELELSRIIHVISDIHDPVSNTDESSPFYLNTRHIASLIQFDFDQREVLPDLLAELDALRFNKHGMDTFIENTSALLTIYRDGW